MANIKLYGTLVRDNAEDKIVNGSQVDGGYFVCNSLPTWGTAGQLCYNTTNSKFYQYNGTEWVEKIFGDTYSLVQGTASNQVKLLNSASTSCGEVTINNVENSNKLNNQEASYYAKAADLDIKIENVKVGDITATISDHTAEFEAEPAGELAFKNTVDIAHLASDTITLIDAKLPKTGDTMTGDITFASSKGINITNSLGGTAYLKENGSYNLEVYSDTGIDVIAAGGAATIQGGSGLDLKANNGSTFPTAGVTITPGASGTVTIDSITVPHGTTGKTFATTDLVTVASTGTSTSKISYITVNGNEYKLAGQVTWGDITGTLSNQVDLQFALDEKLPKTGGTLSGDLTLSESKIEFTHDSSPVGYLNYNTSDYTMDLQSVFGMSLTAPYGLTITTQDITSGKTTIDGTDIPKNSVLATASDLAAKLSKTGDTMTGTLTLCEEYTSDAHVILGPGGNGDINIENKSLYLSGQGGTGTISFGNGSGGTIIGDYTTNTLKINDITVPSGTSGKTFATTDLVTVASIGTSTNEIKYITVNGSEYKLPEGGGTAVAWGSITGTLASQTDLQTALDAKVDKAGDTMTGDLAIVNNSSVEGKLVIGDEAYQSAITIKDAAGHAYFQQTAGAAGMTISSLGGLELSSNNNISITPGDTLCTVTIDSILVPHGTTGKTFAVTDDIITYTAGKGIDITNNTIKATGVEYKNNETVQTNALKFVQCTASEYSALTKDADTFYIIIG